MVSGSMVSFGKESEACWNELAVSEKFLERLEIKIPIAKEQNNV
jgi:hypothetical protein